MDRLFQWIVLFCLLVWLLGRLGTARPSFDIIPRPAVECSTSVIGVQGKEQGDEGCRGFEEDSGSQRKLWGEKGCFSLVQVVVRVYCCLTLTVLSNISRPWSHKGGGALGRSEKPNEIKIRPGNTTLARLKTHDTKKAQK